jgi:hypothetical protein
VVDQQPATTLDRQCPKCHQNNRIGVVFCEKCGSPLLASAANYMPKTRIMTDEELREITKRATGQISNSQMIARGSTFHPGMAIQFTVNNSSEKFELIPTYGTPMIFGRPDGEENFRPEIDLMPYGGFAGGISRRHASMTLINSRLQLMDMNSSNGTYINGERLAPRKPIELRDGDSLRFGMLSLKLSFRR